MPARRRNSWLDAAIDVQLLSFPPPTLPGAAMTTTRHWIGALILMVGVHGRDALGQSARGRWEGTVYGTPNGDQPSTVTLDSTATGWTGTVSAPGVIDASMPFSSVVVHGDSITLTLPLQSNTIVLKGVMGADKRAFSGVYWVDGGDGGTFKFTRPSADDHSPTRRATMTISGDSSTSGERSKLP
jgi:hypothetical protein